MEVQLSIVRWMMTNGGLPSLYFYSCGKAQASAPPISTDSCQREEVELQSGKRGVRKWQRHLWLTDICAFARTYLVKHRNGVWPRRRVISTSPKTPAAKTESIFLQEHCTTSWVSNQKTSIHTVMDDCLNDFWARDMFEVQFCQQYISNSIPWRHFLISFSSGAWKSRTSNSRIRGLLLKVSGRSIWIKFILN